LSIERLVPDYNVAVLVSAQVISLVVAHASPGNFANRPLD
jgi:hypothetical protein